MHSLSEIGGVIRSIVYEGIEVERNPHFVTVLFEGISPFKEHEIRS